MESGVCPINPENNVSQIVFLKRVPPPVKDAIMNMIHEIAIVLFSINCIQMKPYCTDNPLLPLFWFLKITKF